MLYIQLKTLLQQAPYFVEHSTANRGVSRQMIPYSTRRNNELEISYQTCAGKGRRLALCIWNEVFTGLPAGNDMQRQNDLRVGVSSIHAWWPPTTTLVLYWSLGGNVFNFVSNMLLSYLKMFGFSVQNVRHDSKV